MKRDYFCNIFDRAVDAEFCYDNCKEAQQKWCRRRDFHNYFSTSEIRYAKDDSVVMIDRQEDVNMDVSIMIPPADRFLNVRDILKILESHYRRALLNSLSINGFDYSVSGKRPVVCDKYINVPEGSHLFEDIIYPTNGAHRAMMCNLLKIRSMPITLNIWDCGAEYAKKEKFFDTHNMNRVYRKARRKLGFKNGVVPFDIEQVPKRKAWDIWIHSVNDETQRRLALPDGSM